MQPHDAAGMPAPFSTPVGSMEQFYQLYDVYEDLGSGQFAIVRRCRNKQSNIEFAAKFIRKRRFNASRRGVKRSDIEREIVILKWVGGHENIISLQEIYESPNEVVLVLELVSGGELFDHVCARENLTEEEAAAFVRQILRAVQHLHQNNIIHLDLKPENVMLKEKASSHIKLIDFGLSRRILPTDQVRDMIGTPEFVAPEVVNYECLSAATDMWALGVVTYILLSGVSPFLGNDRDGTFANISAVNYDFEERFFSHASDIAKDFIRRLFVKDPIRRMTVDQCLEHPWIRPSVEPQIQSQKERQIDVHHLKSFSIRKKWRSCYYAILLCNRLIRNARIRHGGMQPPISNVSGGGGVTDNDGDQGMVVDPPAPPSNPPVTVDPAILTANALFCATEDHNISGLEELLSVVKMDVNIQNDQGETALHLACYSGFGDATALLLSNGAKPSLLNTAGETPLHYACRRGHLDCIRLLLAANVDINQPENTNCTPLHLAVEGRHTDAALYLLHAGAQMDLENGKGETALHIASCEGLLTLVQALCALGCSVDVRNSSGMTALHLASREGHMEVVRVLCLAGADVHATDSNDFTPETLALAVGFAKVADLVSKLKNDQQKEIFVEQLCPGTMPLRRVKLKVFGDSGVGKSVLIQSLRASLISSILRRRSDGSLTKEESLTIPNGRPPSQKNKVIPPDNSGYSRGIDVQQVNVNGVGEFSVWEFSGYPSYHMIYDHFVGNTDCVHVIMFRLTDPQEVQYNQVLYWLNFLKARIMPGDIGELGRAPKPAHVILVGTNADSVSPPLSRSSDGEYCCSEADAMRQTLEVRFATDFAFHECLILLDARQTNSVGIKTMKNVLGKLKVDIVDNLTKNNGFLEASLTYMAQLRKNQAAFPVLSWPAFVEMVRVNVNPLAGEVHCRQLIQQLQLMGDVVYLKGEMQDFDYVVLNPQWLCHDVLGSLLSFEFLEGCRVTGTYSADDLQLLLFPDIPDMVDLLQLLDALDICAHEEDENEVEYEFPCFIFVEPPGSMWRREYPDYAYGGLRLRAPHGQEHMLGNMFARLQVQLRRSLAEFQDPMDCDLAQWRDCSTLCSGNMEALIRLHKRDQAFEIQVRGPSDTRTSCFYFLEDLINIAEQTVAGIAPGLPLERHFLSPRDLTAHSPNPLVYPPDSVIRMQTQHKTTLKSPSSEENAAGESFVEVVCFGRKDVAFNLTLGIDLPISQLPLHARRELATLLDPPDALGRDWSILGATLGLEEALKEVDCTGPQLSKTDQILVEWSVSNPNSNIGTLITKLQQLERQDALDILYRSVPLYLITSPTTDDNENEIPDKKALLDEFSSSDMLFGEE